MRNLSRALPKPTVTSHHKKEKSLGLKAPGNAGPLRLCKVPCLDSHKQFWRTLWKITLPSLTWFCFFFFLTYSEQCKPLTGLSLLFIFLECPKYQLRHDHFSTHFNLKEVLSHLSVSKSSWNHSQSGCGSTAREVPGPGVKSAGLQASWAVKLLFHTNRWNKCIQAI